MPLFPIPYSFDAPLRFHVERRVGDIVLIGAVTTSPSACLREYLAAFKPPFEIMGEFDKHGLRVLAYVHNDRVQTRITYDQLLEYVIIEARGPR